MPSKLRILQIKKKCRYKISQACEPVYLHKMLKHKLNPKVTSVTQKNVPSPKVIRAVERSENPRVPVLFGGHNLPPLVN